MFVCFLSKASYKMPNKTTSSFFAKQMYNWLTLLVSAIGSICMYGMCIALIVFSHIEFKLACMKTLEHCYKKSSRKLIFSIA